MKIRRRPSGNVLRWPLGQGRPVWPPGLTVLVSGVASPLNRGLPAAGPWPLLQVARSPGPDAF
jgi:hypothetical protein